MWDTKHCGSSEVSKEWKFDNEIIEDGKCSDTEKPVKVTISMKCQRQIKALCRKLPKLEWLAALEGRKNEDGSYVVDSLKLFEQKVTGCFCEYTDKGNGEVANTPNLVGWIHSHNTMSAFFSPTDKQTAKMNTISIVVNNEFEFTGVVKSDFPCGKKALVKAELYTEFEEMPEIESEIDEKIIKSSVVSTKAVSPKHNGDNDCAFCGMKVGKKNKREYYNGVAHQKCFEKYIKEVAIDEKFCDECGKPHEDCLCELELGYAKETHRWCEKCGTFVSVCGCEDMKSIEYYADYSHY